MKALEISEQEIPEELTELVRKYKIKLERGEAEKVKISGYLGRGYQFDANEKVKTHIERKLLASGYGMEVMDEKEMNKTKEKYTQLKTITHKSQALTVRQPTLKEKYDAKMKLISKDVKAKQIALDVGMTAAKSAIISGKSEEETLALVHEAITKALENYKPTTTVQGGVKSAIKIIDEWEEKENIKKVIEQIESTYQSESDSWKKICRILFESCYHAFRIVAGCIKITESGKTESFKLIVPGHDFFDFKFCESVIVFRVLRMVFIHWKILRCAKSCS